MDERMDKAQFLDSLRAERGRWEAALARVSEGHMARPGVVGDWSVKDLVAHVTWYERETLELLRRRAVPWSGPWSLSGDERNRAIFAQHRDWPWGEVVAEARDVYRQLLAALEALPEEDFHDPRRFQGMPEDWLPWRLFAGNTSDHYRHHLPAVQAWLDRGDAGRA
jgi:uncharacterized damage-inducible protein DinB